jgi:hypothetical protein
VAYGNVYYASFPSLVGDPTPIGYTAANSDYAHLLHEELDGVPRIHSARRLLAKAEEEVAKAHQAQTEARAAVQSASSEEMLIGSCLKKPNARRASERKLALRRSA